MSAHTVTENIVLRERENRVAIASGLDGTPFLTLVQPVLPMIVQNAASRRRS